MFESSGTVPLSLLREVVIAFVPKQEVALHPHGHSRNRKRTPEKEKALAENIYHLMKIVRKGDQLLTCLYRIYCADPDNHSPTGPMRARMRMHNSFSILEKPAQRPTAKW
jgi:hypothetical protein